MQFFSLKELCFTDGFDYLVCVDKSPVSAFIAVSSASLAFLSVLLIPSQGMLMH